MTSAEPQSESSALLMSSSSTDRKFLLDDDNFRNGPLHCQWGQTARRIVYDCLDQISASGGLSPPARPQILKSSETTSSASDLATGSLGTWAYLQYELSKHCDNEEHRMLLLESARDFCLKMLKTQSDEHETMDQETLSQFNSISIFTNNNIGAHALLTVVYNEMDHALEGREHLRILLRIWKEASVEFHTSTDNKKANSLWNGLAGALQGIYFLRRELYSPIGARDLVVDIAKLLMQLIYQSFQRHQQPDSMLFGRIGVLYTLLGLEKEEWEMLEKDLPGCQRVAQDAIEAFYIFTVQVDKNDPSWANGTTGQVMLLLRASQVFQHETYYQAAREYAQKYLLTNLHDNSNIGLSDGLVGVLFALRYLQEETAAERLVQVACSSLTDLTHNHNKYGVFDGLGGLALLLMGMAESFQPPSFPFLHPPAAPMPSSFQPEYDESIFEESDLLAIDNFNFGPKASVQENHETKTPVRNNSTHGAVESNDLRQRMKTDEPSRHSTPSKQNGHFGISSPPRNSFLQKTSASTPARETKIPMFSTPAKESKTQTPMVSTPTSTATRGRNPHASPSPTLKAALKPTKIPTPVTSKSVSSQLSRQRVLTPPRPNTKSKAVQKQLFLTTVADTNGEEAPNSPPRTKRLGTEYRVISEYQFQDRNGKFGRRIMSRCLENTSAEGNLLTGGIGPCVYLRLKMSIVSETNRTQLLKAALVEVERAMKTAKKKAGASSPNIFADEYVGTKCLHIFILYRLGWPRQAIENANDLLKVLQNGSATLPLEACDVLDGRAGVLKTIWFLRSALEDPNFGRSLALQLSKQIMFQGMKTAQKYDSESLLMWEWKGKPYLGAAHGVVGILHALLGHSDEERDILESMMPRVKDVIVQAIESMEGCCDEPGNLRKRLKDQQGIEGVSMVHGSPGYCILLAKASICFPAKKKSFVSLATRLANATLRSSRINYGNGGLIRGVSGIGYTFLALSQLDVDNSSEWVSKAETLAHDAVDELDSMVSNSLRPYSLFEGIGGLASLLFDLMHPENASFPFYDI